MHTAKSSSIKAREGGGHQTASLQCFFPSSQMRATPLAAAVGAPSRRKRWELDNDLDTECPIRKQARIGPQPRLPSCPLPPSPLPAPAHACAGTTASRLGPYVLLEPEEGGRAYWALHCPSGTEYTCKVRSPRVILPQHHRGPGKGLGSRGLPGLRGPYITLFLCLLGKQPVSLQLSPSPRLFWSVCRRITGLSVEDHLFIYSTNLH